MTNNSNRLPLWEVMQDAGFNSEGTPRDAIAAQIKALKDWLIPDEEGDPPIVGYKPTRSAVVVHAMWKQRQYLRDLLTAEVNRAKHVNINN